MLAMPMYECDAVFYNVVQVPLKTTLGVTMSPKNGIYLEIATRH